MTVTTFTATGSPTTFIVPAGVHSLHVVEDGAAGSDNSNGSGTPGKGERLEFDLPVTPGWTLDIYVAVAGSASANVITPTTGGFGYVNGGSASGRAGTGGGASGILHGLTPLGIAAGGGGVGADASGNATPGDGGNGGEGGTDGTDGSGGLFKGGGGHKATSSAGGSKGTSVGSPFGGIYDGGSNYAGFGVAFSGTLDGSGGGAGGGYYGGGGGGGGEGTAAGPSSYGGGGGGGGGYGYTDGTATGVTSTAGARSGDGQITFTYRSVIPHWGLDRAAFRVA